MSINMEVNQQIDAEHVLHDVMDDVCQYLSAKDLSNVAQTSRSWYDAGSREIAKRDHIQSLRLPCKYDKPTEIWTPYLTNMRPYASLMIYDRNLYKPAMKKKPQHYCLEEELMEGFKKNLRIKVALMKVHECLTSDDVEGTRNQCHLAKTDNCSILGLLFPNVQSRVHVNMAWAEDCLHLEGQAVSLAEQLGLRDSAWSKSTLLLFVHSQKGYKIANMLIRDRVMDGKDTVWAIGLQNRLMAADCRYKSNRTEKCVVAIRISGPSLESWTALIDCRLRPAEIEQKLRELKEKVTPRRFSTGLFYAPRIKVKCSSQAIMRQVKRVFPNIPFVGLFNGNTAVYQTPDNIGMHGNVDPLNFWLENYYMSIVIIAYN